MVFYIFNGNVPLPFVSHKVTSFWRNKVSFAPRVAFKAQYFIGSNKTSHIWSPYSLRLWYIHKVNNQTINNICCTNNLRLETYTWLRVQINNNICCTYSLRLETYIWLKIKHITTYIAPEVWDSRHTFSKESHKEQNMLHQELETRYIHMVKNQTNNNICRFNNLILDTYTWLRIKHMTTYVAPTA